MRKIFSILFSLVLVVLLMFGACVAEENGGEPTDIGEPTVETWQPNVHGEVTFSQLEWMKSPREALYPYSNVGEVEFAFEDDAGDWLLTEHGGGWLNVVIDTTAAGGQIMWSVQNLYLTYKNMDYLLGSKPSVQFSLGLDNDTPIEVLEAAVFLSSEPLEAQPEAEEHSRYTVNHTPYLVGGVDGGGSAFSDIPLTIGPFIGVTALLVRTAGISITAADMAAIDEVQDGCVPGAVARSIYYLGEVHGFDTENPQDIYDGLADAMYTDIGGSPNALAGKHSYCEDSALPIYTQTNTVYVDPSNWGDVIMQVQDVLDVGCDVEVAIQWSGNSCSGHMAMVTSVTKHILGSTTIRYVDDPNQGDGTAENSEHVITTDNAGKFNNGASRVRGFWFECFSG